MYFYKMKESSNKVLLRKMLLRPDRDRLQVSPLILIEFKQINYFTFPLKYQKTIGFLMSSGGMEVD